LPDLRDRAPTGEQITAVSAPQVPLSWGRCAVIDGRITYYSKSFHPDVEWGNTDGMTLGQMCCLFLNVGGGPYASMVVRHEIGHASDHVSYGPGDHCPLKNCLMYALSEQKMFCTQKTHHSVKRTEGWSP
jgi:hypothetical protein